MALQQCRGKAVGVYAAMVRASMPRLPSAVASKRESGASTPTSSRQADYSIFERRFRVGCGQIAIRGALNMHINQIIIQGFKSYKDQTVIEPFSAGLNVIVGRNGSGKSNFFAAIRFVLSDAYGQMGREERQALLHEGSGSAVMSAYVEVIFDNPDQRFPNGKPELILRRTIGMKKDEYTLDRKSSTKAEVMNMLESAGFSRSNPYYIVPQGRVTHITNMKDTDRLTLLKEVAGTQVYEARRTESLKIMQETENKRSKIDDLLTYIELRLGQLEEEKEELRKYQEKDREHRCLQYTIYHREQVEIQRHLADIDEKRTAGVDETDTNRTAMEDNERGLARLETEMVEAKQNLDYHMLERQQLDDERKETRREKAKIELDVQSLSAGQSAAQQAKERHDQELRDVQHLIKQRENELVHLMPSYNNTKTKETAVRAELDQAESTRRRLFTKQGRSAQFKSKKERDDFLQREINDFNVQLAARKSVLVQTEEEIASLEKMSTTLETTMTNVQGKLDERGNGLDTLAKNADEAKERQEQLQDRRRELWRSQNQLQSSLKAAQADLDNAEHVLQRKVDRTMWQGIKSVRRIKEQHKIEGIYGTVGELLEVNEMYETAVEVTAGQSLFHYVVDNDETVTKVMEILNKEKSGRVTFMPLNRLKPRSISMPKTSDAVPMMSKLKYDSKYDKAFEQVFGKAVICPSIAIAAQCARSHGVSAITPGGDRADKKGALTGGWYDTTKSSLKAVRREAKCRHDLELQTEQYKAVADELITLDQEITAAMSEVRKVEQRKMQMDNSYSPLRQQLRSLEQELQRTRINLESQRTAKENISMEQRRLTEEQHAYETELQSEFKKALTTQEEHLLESLGARVQELRKLLSQLSTERSNLENQKVSLEEELRENLRRRLDQLTSQEAESGSFGFSSTANTSTLLKDRQRALKRIAKVLEDLTAKFAEADQAVEQANQRLANLQAQKAETQQKQEELARLIEHHQKRMEKNMQKKAMLNEKLSECNRNIRDLGVLPEEAFKKYERLDSDKAIKRLHGVKEALKKFANVNKKAYQQYKDFTNQRDTLKKRRVELDSSQRSIEELIESLDHRKDEAIERTFRQVSKEFAVVFETLVPAGKGRLVIQRRSDKQPDEDEDEGPSRRKGHSNVENYTGVGISVSFNSKHDEQQRIGQLSGGQKSLCALGLIFAIQRCDPAPFYLFDEIDANLDAQYRTAVAKMLKDLSDHEAREAAGQAGGQFICTTFRPEMVNEADKCYGVTYTNKTSSIDVVNREHALDFVDGATSGK